MNIDQIIKDKSLKPKERTLLLSNAILDNSITIIDLIHYAERQKDSPKGTCIESIEYASMQKAEIVSEIAIEFCVKNLSSIAPRVKWESAKVIGNCIHLFQDKIPLVVPVLLNNTEDKGTVVKWSSAYALAQILLLNTHINTELVPVLRNIYGLEEKNSIKKIYKTAFKKLHLPID